MSLEKTHRMNMLFSFYGDLLTDKQKDYMTYYHIEDYSLGEIADLKDVSRQAVYDNIKRSEKALEDYEEALAMYEKFEKLQGLVKELEGYHTEDTNYQALVDQLKKL